MSRESTFRQSAALRAGWVVLCVAIAGASVVSAGELWLAPMFSDHMVVQRDMPVPVWGTAEAGETVVVRWRGQSHQTTATDDGSWRVDLPAAPAGGPETLTITCGDASRVLRDVLIGEVWLCSGQSNMAWPVKLSKAPEKERAAAEHPRIRLLNVPQHFARRPQTDFDATWHVCGPETVGDFSAVAYYFGRELHRELGVPIGLLQSAVGGTRIECWIHRDVMKGHPQFADRIEKLETAIREYESLTDAQREAKAAALLADYENRLERYWKTTGATDPGIRDHWEREPKDAPAWRPYRLAVDWESAGIPELRDFDGCVWFRTFVDIPDEWAGRELTLHLAPIDDSDTTFFNGQRIGRTTWQHSTPRAYTIPAGMVIAGEACIAVQAIDYGGGGGFDIRPGQVADQMSLVLADDKSQKLALVGQWQYRIAVSMDKLARAPRRPRGYEHPGTVWTAAGSLYNGMIAPLVPYGMRGAIWYQGESNASEPEAYSELLPLQIQSWRKTWDQPGAWHDFPFGIVQLANFRPDRPDEPAPGGWAWLREAQLKTSEQLANAGLAVTIDVGEADDIHPKDKQTVGRRLALWVLATVHGMKAEYSGPIYDKMEHDGESIILHFTHTSGGLETRDGKRPMGFAIAGPDREFAWANAEIRGDTVRVYSDRINEPVAVRYAWATNPASANLINGAGLPASPFRTDAWPVE